jgi:hypothetical protein
MRLNINIYWYCIVSISVWILFACKQRPNESIRNHQVRVVEARGYVVPKDSIAPPKILPRKKPRVVPAIHNKMVAAKSNVHIIDSLKTSFVVEPKIVTPGQNSVLFPEKLPATGKTVATGLPTITSANEVNAIDLNPKNFSSFNKMKGLNNARIQYMFEDSLGNLWFGTEGNRVSKYDGKSFTNFNAMQSYCDELKVETKEG